MTPRPWRPDDSPFPRRPASGDVYLHSNEFLVAVCHEDVDEARMAMNLTISLPDDLDFGTHKLRAETVVRNIRIFGPLNTRKHLFARNSLRKKGKRSA